MYYYYGKIIILEHYELSFLERLSSSPGGSFIGNSTPDLHEEDNLSIALTEPNVSFIRRFDCMPSYFRIVLCIIINRGHS